MNTVFLIACFVAVSVGCLFAIIWRWVWRTNEIQQRLAVPVAVAARVPVRQSPISGQINRQLGGSALAARTERNLSRGQFESDRRRILADPDRLCRAGAWASAGSFPANQWAGLLLAIGGWLLPGLMLQRRRAKRAKMFGDQLPDLLSLLVGSLRAGYGLMHACRLIQQEMPDPMATEFGQVIKETMLGYSVDDALDHLVERVDNEDLELVVAAIHIQNEVGGSLAEVLATISDTIRERIKFKGDIQAMTGQQRMTGWLLTALPFVIATAMMLLNPDYMMGLFQPGLILAIPIGAVVLVVIGNLAMRWMMKIEV